VIEAIKEGQNRVKTMGLIHQNLYQEDDLRGVNIKNYVTKLTKNLFNSYNIQPEKVQLRTNITVLQLDVDTVVPIGLIINELVTNALKYAFSNEKNGTIEVNLFEENNQMVLQVKDDGIGLPDDFDIEKLNSMGFKNFATKLSAKLNIENQNGAFVELLIPKK
jgi:two-component system, sensor histidine kinase PdtaS